MGFNKNKIGKVKKGNKKNFLAHRTSVRLFNNNIESFLSVGDARFARMIRIYCLLINTHLDLVDPKPPCTRHGRAPQLDFWRGSDLMIFKVFSLNITSADVIVQEILHFPSFLQHFIFFVDFFLIFLHFYEFSARYEL